MSLLWEFIGFIAVPPGNLIYHLVTLFEIQLILGIALQHWNRHRREPVAVRMLVTGVDLAFARALLMLVAVLDRVGVLSSPIFLPPLERFLELVTLLLVAGAFLPVLERHPRAGTVLLFLVLFISAGVYVSFAVLWPGIEARGVVYTAHWQGAVWEVFTVAVLGLGLLSAVVWRADDWGLIVCLFLLWLIGHSLQLVVPGIYSRPGIVQAHAAGWVRLANLAALPLLAGLVYRRALSASQVWGTATVETWLQRGVSAARAGDRSQARCCFQAARELDPDNVVALLWLAWLAHTSLESLALFSRVLEMDPQNKDAHLGIRWTRRCLSPGGDEGVVVGSQPTTPFRWRLVHADQRPPVSAEDRAPDFSFLRGAVGPAGGREGVRTGTAARRSRQLGSLGSAMGVLLHFAVRLLPTPLILVALIFFVALAMNLGQAGGLRALPSSAVDAVGFTVEYLAALAHGDLGLAASPYPAAPPSPVAAELAQALPRSLGLLAVALALAIFVGLLLGIGASLRRRSRFSGFLVFLSVLGISTPSYFAAMLLIWFGVWLYRVTGMDFLPLHGFGWDAHLILPALVLAARPAANVMRLGYNALAEVLDADFVRTAYAKGLGPWVVLLRHVLRNAGVPLLTTVTVSLRFSLAILPIVEYIFNWSGVGQKLLAAIQGQDTTTAVGMILPLAFLLVFVNLLLETLCLIVDPRLRVKEAGAV